MVFPLDYTVVLESGNRIIAELERPLLDSREPALKARKVERILLQNRKSQNRDLQVLEVAKSNSRILD